MEFYSIYTLEIRKTKKGKWEKVVGRTEQRWKKLILCTDVHIIQRKTALKNYFLFPLSINFSGIILSWIFFPTSYPTILWISIVANSVYALNSRNKKGFLMFIPIVPDHRLSHVKYLNKIEMPYNLMLLIL